MIRRLLFVFTLLIATAGLGSTAALAQTTLNELPNAGFESWTDGQPDNWLDVSPMMGIGVISQYQPAHSGQFAIRGEVKEFGGGEIATPYLVTDAGGDAEHPVTGVPFHGHPTSFSGYYRFHPVNGDNVTVFVYLLKDEATIGVGEWVSTQQQDDYQRFAAPITYTGDAVGDADHILVIATVTGPVERMGSASIGSWFVLDDLGFQQASSKVQHAGSADETWLLQNYPNPSIGTTTIRYNLSSDAYTSLRLFNMEGEEVLVLQDGMMNKGDHKVQLDTRRLASGIYTYRLASGNMLISRTLQVVK